MSLHTNEVLDEILNLASDISTRAVKRGMRLLNVKSRRTASINTIKICLAIEAYGLDITIPLLQALYKRLFEPDEISYPLILNRVHTLGDYFILEQVKGRARTLKYGVSEKFKDACTMERLDDEALETYWELWNKKDEPTRLIVDDLP